jgi:hypothetical protein
VVFYVVRFFLYFVPMDGQLVVGTNVFVTAIDLSGALVSGVVFAEGKERARIRQWHVDLSRIPILVTLSRLV